MDKRDVIKLIDDNTSKIQGLIGQRVDIWREYVLLSDLWWLGVGLSIIPWVLWFFYRKRDSTARLLYAGYFVTITSLALDVLGDQLGFWHYRFNVIPTLPTYLPWDLTLMPVAVMSLLQIKPSANPYLKALVFALLTSYVGEPLFDWIGIYEPTRWRFSYSVPLQFLIYISAHYTTKQRTFETLERS